jgi:hypothetical protein
MPYEDEDPPYAEPDPVMNALTRAVIGAAMEVHRRLGPGLDDLIIDGCLIVELKAVEQIALIHKAQLLTYLKITGLKLGLLLNFNVPALKDGVTRIIRS